MMVCILKIPLHFSLLCNRWTSFENVHWMGPVVGIAISYCGLLLVYLTVFNYVADCYTVYAASGGLCAVFSLQICSLTDLH